MGDADAGVKYCSEKWYSFSVIWDPFLKECTPALDLGDSSVLAMVYGSAVFSLKNGISTGISDCEQIDLLSVWTVPCFCMIMHCMLPNPVQCAGFVILKSHW